MRIYGTLKDRYDNTITVTINNSDVQGTDINIDTSSNIRFSDDPVRISYDTEDSFTHIIKSRAEINLVTKTWLGDYLFANNYTSVTVTITRDNAIIFSGYVTPNTFSQDYSHYWDTLTINCVDKLSVLENQ